VARHYVQKRRSIGWGCSRVLFLVFGLILAAIGIGCLGFGLILIHDVFTSSSEKFDVFSQYLGFFLTGLGGLVAIPGIVAFLSSLKPNLVRVAHVLAILQWVAVIIVGVVLILMTWGTTHQIEVIIGICILVLFAVVYSLLETLLRHKVDMF
jgi:hypothetical protein